MILSQIVQVLAKAWLLLKHWTVWGAGREFFCTLASVGPMPDALCIKISYLTVPTQDCLCHACFADASTIYPTTLSSEQVSVWQNPSQTQWKVHSLFFDRTCIRRVCVFRITYLLAFHFSMVTRKGHGIAASVCLLQWSEPGKDTMNKTWFMAKHENSISVLALLCWCQLKEETNIPEITQK